MNHPDGVTCTEHPDRVLTVNHDNWLPIDRRGQTYLCVASGHGYGETGRSPRYRCARCGGPIPGPQAYMAIYCGTRCRVAAFRAKRKAEAVAGS